MKLQVYPQVVILLLAHSKATSVSFANVFLILTIMTLPTGFHFTDLVLIYTNCDPFHLGYLFQDILFLCRE